MRASLQQVFDKIEAHGFQIADFREERTHSGGPGGQNVNKVETCFCVTHLPTGLRVRCESERSQSANRAKAWHGILEKLLQQRQQIIREKKNLLEKKRRQSRPRPNSVKREFKKLKKRRKEIKSNRFAVSRDPV